MAVARRRHHSGNNYEFGVNARKNTYPRLGFVLHDEGGGMVTGGQGGRISIEFDDTIRQGCR